MAQDSGSKSERRPVFLLGFMACGKSTVGPELARRLGREFVDLDRVIEARADCTIAALIAREGEARFRQMETAALREAAGDGRFVIAPGGGAITRAENRVLMEQRGVTVWLDAPFDLCWQRIELDGTTRPLAPNREVARERYEARLPLYAGATVRVLVREGASAQRIADEIVLALCRARSAFT